METKYDLKKLKELCKEWSDQQIIIEGANDVKGSIADSAKEKLGMEKAEFSSMAKLYHDMTYHSEKFEKARAKAEFVEIVEGLNV